MIIISGTTIPDPSTFEISILDGTKSWRSSDYEFHAEYVATKRKMRLGWRYMTAADIAILFQLVQGVTGISGMFFEVQYPDPQTGANRTGTFYAGDRSASGIDYQNSIMRYKEVKFSLIEQ